MSPGASLFQASHGRRGTVRAMVVAIIFAVIAMLSFAVDQSLTLSGPAAPVHHDAR